MASTEPRLSPGCPAPHPARHPHPPEVVPAPLSHSPPFSALDEEAQRPAEDKRAEGRPGRPAPRHQHVVTGRAGQAAEGLPHAWDGPPTAGLRSLASAPSLSALSKGEGVGTTAAPWPRMGTLPYAW